MPSQLLDNAQIRPLRSRSCRALPCPIRDQPARSVAFNVALCSVRPMSSVNFARIVRRRNSIQTRDAAAPAVLEVLAATWLAHGIKLMQAID